MIEGKFLNPKNDVAFKRIFGSEKNKDILIHFLNDMLSFKSKKPIKEVTFLKTHQDPEIASKKESIVDVLCQDEDGNKYVVEMQVAEHDGFIKRAQYYAAKAYIAEMKRGDPSYENLKEVIFLSIADFVLFPDKEAYKSDHIILDNETYENDLKDFSFTFLELPKFKLEKHELKTMTEKWAYYFKNAPTTMEEELVEIFKDDPAICHAYEELNRFHWTDEELQFYESDIKRIRDNNAVRIAQQKKIKRQLEESMEKGLEKGRSEGMEKGIEKGMKKGMERGIEKGKLEIAKAMLQKGIDAQTIMEVTGISAGLVKEVCKFS